MAEIQPEAQGPRQRPPLEQTQKVFSEAPPAASAPPSQGGVEGVREPGLRAALMVVNPEGHQTVFTLDRAVVRIGRDQVNDICVPDRRCSRKHCLIEMAGDFYNLVDLNSTNGVRVNGHKVSQRRLRDGDVFEIGAYQLIYRGPTDETIPDELAPASAQSAAAPAPAPAPAPAAPFQEAVEGLALPEGDEPAPPPAPAVEETAVCPKCQVPLPPALHCDRCGYRSLRLRAVEHYVDHIMSRGSVLGSLGLRKLKRQQYVAQALARRDVAWVLEVPCAACGKKHRLINEWCPRCLPCPACGQELSLPVGTPPELG